MIIDLKLLVEWAGALTVIAGALGIFYRLIDKKLLRPIKEDKEAITSLVSWTTKQQIDITDNRECNQMLIMALRACLDGLHQQGCNGQVTKAAADLDTYILARCADTKSKLNV